MKKNYVKWVVAALATVLLLVGCGKEAQEEKPVPFVKTITVGASEITDENTFPGTVHGRTESALAFQIGGKIVERLVQAGDRVAAGDPLYRLDSKDVSEQVAAAEGQVAAAKAQLELATSNLRRFEELYAQGAISEMNIDQARNAQQLAQAQYDTATAALGRARNQESFATLRSDRDGVVGMTMMEVGQVTGPGTPVVVVVDDSEMDVLISLVESNVHNISIGQRAKVTFWARPDWEISGVVREIAAAPNPQTGTYDAKVGLTEVPADMQVGMTAQVRFTTGESKVITVPLTAMATQSETPAVWVVRDGEAHMVQVKTGAYEGDKIEILSGLKAGDVVVVAGTQHLEEGKKVRI